MKEPEWVERATVLALQERLLAEFGAGIRDENLLESALARPLIVLFTQSRASSSWPPATPLVS